MNLTRFGFNCLVVVYLLPLVLMDIIGNTVSTGAASDFYYYKTMFDGLLIAYAIYELATDSGTATREQATARRNNHTDSVVDFGAIGAFEYVYCGFLCLYAGVNWYSLHAMNKLATGFESIATLVWSFVSLAVVILAAVQFWRLKSGTIVELKHKAMG